MEATLTYSLAGDDKDDFSISSTGVITFNRPPDAENPDDNDSNNIYTITVVVSDGSLTIEKNITIAVTGTDDTPPRFTNSNHNNVISKTTTEAIKLITVDPA